MKEKGIGKMASGDGGERRKVAWEGEMEGARRRDSGEILRLEKGMSCQEVKEWGRESMASDGGGERRKVEWEGEEKGVGRRDGGLQAVAAASGYRMLFCDALAFAAYVEERALFSFAAGTVVVVHADLRLRYRSSVVGTVGGKVSKFLAEMAFLSAQP